MTDLQGVVGLAGAPVVAALVEAVVKPFVSDKRVYPVSALILGIVWNVGLALIMDTAVAPAAVLGVLSGLSASGLYSASKALRETPDG